MGFLCREIPSCQGHLLNDGRMIVLFDGLQGGLLLWIAPSGGRDRPNEDDVWMPAKFDPSAVELMRHLISRAKPDGHLFPLAMHSGEMMPPPKGTEKALGERRLTSFVGVGERLNIPFAFHLCYV